ncbi:MAG TPA: ATP-binding protein [Planctomycetaceae bacterium]|jgi:PAS domain S-box-containing protein|nr:ATP-binding protein [Planctomycetaceae bacterium]
MNTRLKPVAVWLTHVVCVSVAIFLVGRLGWVSIVPSGELVHVWTASGVALGTLLFFGNRLWPAVWLGSFLLEVSTIFEGSTAHATASSLVFAASVATATTLQAAAGNWLIRRALGKVPALDNVNEVLALLGLGGVLSTALGAAARSISLTDHSRFLPHLLTVEANWAAELTGVFVFAPVTLILLSPKTWQFCWPRAVRLLESVAIFVVIPVIVSQIGNDRESDYGVILVAVAALWATLRFGKVGTGLNLLVMALMLASNVKTGTQLLGTIRTSPATATTDAQILQITFSVTFWSLAAILNERERVATHLRESEARFRQFSEGMSHVIWMMTPDKQRFLYVNQAFEQIYGRSREELYASSDLWLACIHADDRQRVGERRSGQGGASEYSEEYRVVHTDGTVRWLRESAVPLRNEQGEIAMFGGTIEDITQSRLVAQKLARHQSELLHVSRLSSVGQMVATLSHEVAQPMSAIGTFATVCAGHLQLEPPDNLDRSETLKQCIEAIAAENQRCRAILRRLRDYTRKTPRRRTACDLNAVLRESVDLIVHELRRHDVKVVCELDRSTPPVCGDRIQLQQVIINLLTNARDAMLHVDPLRRVVVLRSQAAGDSVVLEVEDQGSGIPQEESGRIFEPFFTTKEEGMGIGLSICKTIVEEHGGEIQALTNASGGATFRILIPVSAETPDQQRLPLQPA